MRRTLVVPLLLAAACGRDLALPDAHRLALSPGFSAVAPRERLRLTAEGGAGTNAFDFAQGGRLSGDDASIDPVTGDYVAGSRGSAIDVVQVSDRAGGVATARISVGPPIAVTPSLAGTAPRGTLTFTATGGKPPYTFTLTGQAGSGSTLTPAGLYTAGPGSGDAVEKIVVTDATADTLARAVADVHVGRALGIFPSADQAAAPRERLQFTGLGGEPPYTYSITGGSGGAVDAAGIYQAGTTGSTVDWVEARDQRGSTALVKVVVGPALSVTLVGGSTRPAVAALLTAAGGKAPYAFRYAWKGNRTRGSVAPSGAYVPGSVVGAVDVVEVVDAVGVVASRALPPLRPWQVRSPGDVNQCLAADLDGDGREDAILAGSNQIVDWRLAASGGSQSTSYRLRSLSRLYPEDLTGDGKTDLIQVYGLPALVSDLTGTLQLGNSPIPGYAHFAAVQRTPGGYLQIATDVPCDLPCSGAGCPAQTDFGVTVIYWDFGSAAPLQTACEPGVHSGRTQVYPLAFTAGYLAPGWVFGVAWLESTAGPLRLSTRPYAAAYPFSPPVDIPFPSGWTYSSLEPDGAFFALPLDYNRSEADVAVLLADGNGRNALFVLRDQAFVGPFDPDPAGPGIARVRARAGLDGETSLVSWNGVDGRIMAFEWLRDGTFTAPRLGANLPYAVTCASLPDVNGDGIPDLVGAGGSSPTADVLIGEGSTFGARVHFGGFGQYGVGDVDGDGLDDVVVATDTPGLRVHYGGGHQLAFGPETSVGRMATAVVAGRVGAGFGVLWQDVLAQLWSAEVAADGTLGAPSPIAVDGYATTAALPSQLTGSNAPHLADLGGSEPGDDLWWRTNDAAGEAWNGLLRDGPGHATWIRSTAAGTWCHFGVIGPPGGAVTHAAAGCIDDDGAGGSVLALRRAALGAGGSVGPWQDAGTLAVADTGGSRILWLGQWGGRTAFLLEVLPLATQVPERYAATIDATGATAFAAISTILPPGFVASGDYADYDGDGLPDLALVTAGAGQYLEISRGLPGGGLDVPAAATRIGGYVAGSMRLTAGKADPLLLVGSELVPFPLAP